MEQAKKMIRRLLLVMCMAVVCFIGTAVTAHAANLEQSGIQTSGIPIKWTAPSGVVSYTLYAGADSSSLQYVASPSKTATSYTVPAEAGSRKYIKLEYTYKSGSYQGSSYYTLYDAKTLPSRVTGVQQTKWWYYIKSADVAWTRVDSADGYELIFRNSKGGVVKKETLTYNSSKPTSSLSKISNNKIYTLEVRAYTTFNGTKYPGEYSAKAYLFTSPTVKSSKITNGKLKVTWTPVSGATGYDIYVSTSAKKGYKKVKTISGGSKKSATVSKFKGKKFGKKRYYVYVVTRKKVGTRLYKSGSEYYWKVGSSSRNWF